jgi:hypothetical protein
MSLLRYVNKWKQNMHTQIVKIGSRYQKTSPPNKIYRVIATIARDTQLPHAQLAAEVDPSQVITVSASALTDPQLWRQVS